jgi:hypothetical protein
MGAIGRVDCNLHRVRVVTQDTSESDRYPRHRDRRPGRILSTSSLQSSTDGVVTRSLTI